MRSAAILKLMARRDIDRAAVHARAGEIPAGLDLVYLIKAMEAQAYIAARAANPATAVPGPYLAAEAARMSRGPLALAQTIAARAEAWHRDVGAAIEAARVAGRAAVAAASGADDEMTRQAIWQARDDAIAEIRQAEQ